MGFSSLIVVLNSLRLSRLGRTGVDKIRPPAVMRGLRGFVLSVAVPVVLFAGATVGAQAVVPEPQASRLLAQLEAEHFRRSALPHGIGAEVYLQSSSAGVNQFHVIFTPPSSSAGTLGTPHVVASGPAGSTMALRIVRLSPGHYSAYGVFAAGSWRFTATESRWSTGRTRSFSSVVRASCPERGRRPARRRSAMRVHYPGTACAGPETMSSRVRTLAALVGMVVLGGLRVVAHGARANRHRRDRARPHRRRPSLRGGTRRRSPKRCVPVTPNTRSPKPWG